MGGISYQQRVIFERVSENNEKFARLNNDMKNRANFITAASTAIVGIITAAKFLPDSASSRGFEFAFLSLVCLCSIGIYWFAALIWKGGNTALTGTFDVDKLYDSYISKDIDVAYCNMLTDLCSAFEQNEKENAARGRYLDRMVQFFILQLVFLAISIGWASFASLL
ncbi:hypothetical protein NCG89_00825 [Spongiibacter taiwanensis]|uniref:hypothetical protein n=1 Tax=Spongiibacter taiwanensis TaxID=1748242 RepID=UPI002035D8B0|nr:hypothetical protein [Spongiibacter taiwanensis]USA43346.1 hypothetical protein NCG89_00825 [Spongiibacter taiwanensis]